MRLDIVIPNQGADALACVCAAPRLEAMGYAGLWLTDHVVGGREFSHYGDCWMEILSSLAFLASSTSQVRLGTGILVLPYRNPVLVAKMLATIDQLSGGRVDLAVGTGYAKSEFEALGALSLYEDRGAATDECLDVIKACWKGGAVGFTGRWFSFTPVSFAPIPVQTPSIPLWVGSRGLGMRPLTRAARYGDYWHPVRLTPSEIIEGGKRIDDLAGRHVKRSARLIFSPKRTTDEIVAEVESFSAAGCEQVALDLRGRSLNGYLSMAESIIRLTQG